MKEQPTSWSRHDIIPRTIINLNKLHSRYMGHCALTVGNACVALVFYLHEGTQVEI